VNQSWLYNELRYVLKVVDRGKNHMIYMCWGNKLLGKFHELWNNNININWIYSWSENSYEIISTWKGTLYKSVWMRPVNFKIVRNKLYVTS